MPDRVYLDWNATTPLRHEAREAMAAACSLAARRAPGSSARKGCAKLGRLVEGAPGPSAVGVRCPIGARTDPGVGLAPDAGAATPNVPAKSMAEDANTKVMRGMRAPDQVAIECLTCATGQR